MTDKDIEVVQELEMQNDIFGHNTKSNKNDITIDTQYGDIMVISSRSSYNNN